MTTQTATKLHIVNVENPRAAAHDAEVHAAGCAEVGRKIRSRDYGYEGTVTASSKLDIWYDYNRDFLGEGGAFDVRFYPCTGLVTEVEDYNGSFDFIEGELV